VTTIRIDSADDPRLSEFRNVPDPDLLARLGLFVAEGRLVVERLLATPIETRALLVTETALASLHALTTDHEFPVYVVPQAVMSSVAGFNFHRGCLAIGVRPPSRDWREIVAGSKEQDPAYVRAESPGATTQDLAYARDAQRLVVLERVGNVDNIGSIFRSAAAFGVDGVLLQGDCADPLYRKAIRTSMAATLSLPFAWAPWPETLGDLAGTGWATIAMTTSPDAPALRDVVTTLARRPVAIVLGHEGDGLTRGTEAACTHRARIAMTSRVNSLNVATAAAIALYEISLST
jgi:tRNA G18 (ribose-2'-O)-methylase SpoU